MVAVPEGTLQALANAAKQLNKHVFLPATNAPHQLLVTACLCCDRMSQLLEGIWWQLQPGPVSFAVLYTALGVLPLPVL
jgi:hypothetical protein